MEIPRAHLYTVAGVVRPAGGCCVLRPRWGATLPKPLSSSQSPLISVSALRRKLRALPCSSSPHKVADFVGTPEYSAQHDILFASVTLHGAYISPLERRLYQ